ncbi:hypothetical protein [Streptomyces sp. YIM S03343]
MPATAPQPEPGGEHTLAPVVSLSGRRGVKAPDGSSAHATVVGDVVDNDLVLQAYRHWVGVFDTAGIALGGAETRAVIRLVTKELERLVSGLVVLREGHGDRLPPNPDAGVDLTSAVEITGILRDLASASEAAHVQS